VLNDVVSLITMLLRADICQHINLAGLAGTHPLRGPNIDDFGVRFPALSDAYDLGLRRQAHQTWKRIERSAQKRRMHEGVYAFVGGPRYSPVDNTHVVGQR